MKIAVEWIRKRQALAFYVLCYAITWGSLLPLLMTGSEIAEVFVLVGLFGPVIACVIVSRVASFPTKEPALRPFWLFLAGGWILSTFAFAANQGMSLQELPTAALVVFGILALIPAYLLASAVSGPSGVRRALSTALRPRGWWGWYVLALILPVILRLTGVWLAKLIGWELLSDPQPPANFIQLAGSVGSIFLYTVIYAGGLNEEGGWTGFALPRLLSRFNPLAATVIVWVLWILWHVPFHLSGYFNLSMNVLIGTFIGRFLMTWLFIRSSGGVLSAILLHTSINVTSQFVPLTNASLLVEAVVSVLVIILGKMWQKLPEESPAVFPEIV